MIRIIVDGHQVRQKITGDYKLVMAELGIAAIDILSILRRNLGDTQEFTDVVQTIIEGVNERLEDEEDDR